VRALLRVIMISEATSRSTAAILSAFLSSGTEIHRAQPVPSTGACSCGGLA
jgi:hypothetical protein